VSVTTWDEALERRDRAVGAVEATIADRAVGVDLDDVRLPANLGPLPARLRPRAEAIRARQQAAEAGLALAVRRARQAMVLGDSSPSAGPSLFDARH
jgi:hypothetical protein